MAGYSGLIRAAEKYNPDTGRFTTYADAWIRREVLAFFREMSTIHIPPDAYQTYRKLRKDARVLFPNLPNADYQMIAEIVHSDEMLTKLCEKFNETSKKRKVTMQRAREILNAVSLSIGNSLEDMTPGVGVPIKDVITTDAGTQEEIVIADEIRAYLADSVGRLPPKHAQVMIRAYGLDGKEPENLAEVGRQLGFSRERARQIHAQSLEKLRKYVDPKKSR